MLEALKCRNCGVDIPSNAPFGHCPKCLFELGFLISAPASTSSTPLATGRVHRFGDYELAEQIGRGGMGVVFKARQIRLDRWVAIKMISAGELASPDVVQRFKVEAEATAQLCHPNIVPTYDVGEYEGHHYFAMKLIEGTSLDQHITKTGFSGPEGEAGTTKAALRKSQVRIAQLMMKVARAVHYAHQRGILHRDLKPSNILLDRAGEPYLTDFGIAKIAQGTLGITASGAIMGTPRYMAPEQAAGKHKQITTAADVYGLGAILYELLTGRPPFGAETPMETLRQVMEQEPRPPLAINKSLDRDLATICLRCLEKDPQRRYKSAEALADDLEHWEKQEPILARPPSTVMRVRRWTRRHPAIALLVLASFICSAYLYVDRTEREETRRRWKAIVAEKLAKSSNDPKSAYVLIESETRAQLTGTKLASLPAGSQQLRLSFGVYPHLPPMQMVESFTSILNDLERSLSDELSRPVVIDLFIYRTYELGEKALENGEVDFMRVGPVSYVLAKSANPAIQLLAAQRHTDFKGAIFTTSNGGIVNFSNLSNGKSFAFGNRNSTATMLAKALLVRSNIFLKDLSTNVVYRSNHREVVEAVLKGYDAGAAKESVAKNRPGLTILVSFPIVGMPWVARSDLEATTVEAIKRSLLKLNNRRSLKPLEDDLEGFQKVTDGEYDPIREAINDANRWDKK